MRFDGIFESALRCADRLIGREPFLKRADALRCALEFGVSLVSLRTVDFGERENERLRGRRGFLFRQLESFFGLGTGVLRFDERLRGFHVADEKRGGKSDGKDDCSRDAECGERIAPGEETESTCCRGRICRHRFVGDETAQVRQQGFDILVSM